MTTDSPIHILPKEDVPLLFGEAVTANDASSWKARNDAEMSIQKKPADA